MISSDNGSVVSRDNCFADNKTDSHSLLDVGGI